MKKDLSTYGNEYTLNYEPYTGWYHIDDLDIPYSGRVHQSWSAELKPISDAIIAYDKIHTFTVGNSPVPVIIFPTDADYEVGWYLRYFSKRTNNVNAPIIEIDKDQYEKFESQDSTINYQLYDALSLRWKISGPLYDVKENGQVKISGVIDTNYRTLMQNESKMMGLRLKLSNLKQFYKIT